jgi:rubrerythrin
MKGGRTDLEAKYFAEQRAKKEMQREKAGPSEKLQHSCSLCGFIIIETWKFCPECGVSLTKK